MASMAPGFLDTCKQSGRVFRVSSTLETPYSSGLKLCLRVDERQTDREQLAGQVLAVVDPSVHGDEAL